jgi:flagellin
MVVRTNMLALNSHRNLGMVGNQQARSSARLSSGFRINSAADDAAGLGISENMRAQIRGLDQASRNAQDAISLIQTAEGGMSTINEMIIRVRELTVQASNDINTTEGMPGVETNASNRARIQGEVDHLVAEIERTAQTLEFNTRGLLNGGGLTMTGLAGVTLLGQAMDGSGSGQFNAAHTQVQADAIRALVDGINQIGGNRLEAAVGGTVANMINPGHSDFNADFTRLVNTLQQGGHIAAGAFADAAAVLTALTAIDGANALSGNPGELFFQVGANAGQGITLTLPDIITNISQELGNVFGNGLTGNIASGTGSEITDLLSEIDAIFAQATAARGELGALQNRLEFTIQNLDISGENLSAANSRIRDADMALEMMRLTQANVLQQAATAMLAQGNQAPQSILQLLG